jgi:chemotaxis response regulator CheB
MAPHSRIAIRVLIADEFQPLRSLLVRLLSHYEDVLVVGDTASGDETIQLAIELRPDVVVMDAALPGIDGVVVTRQLVESVPGTRVVGSCRPGACNGHSGSGRCCVRTEGNTAFRFA